MTLQVIQVIVGLVLLAILGYSLYNQWEMKKLSDGMALRIRSIEATIYEMLNPDKPQKEMLCDDKSCSRNKDVS